MLGIGTNELVIILLFAFLLFGPDKLPGMGRTIGRALKQFREAQEGFTKVVQNEVVDPLTDAMKEPTDKKKSASSSTDEDADINKEDVSDRHSETFAERRERLKSEKQAHEDVEEKPTSESVEDKGTNLEPDAAKDKQDKPDTSAAALYSLTPRKEDGDARN